MSCSGFYCPTAIALDKHMLQSPPESGHRAGYNGGRRREGSMAHIAADTLGHLLRVDWSRLFLNSALLLHAFEFGAQTFNLFALRAAGHGRGEHRALPAAKQSGRQALSAGHARLPGPSSHLAHALGFKGRRVFIAWAAASCSEWFYQA